MFRRLEQEQRQTGDNSSGQVRDYWVQGRNGGKTDFRVFLACIILKYQNGFLICINQKITNSNLHNALPKKLRSEENGGKLQAPRFFWKTAGKHTNEE